MEPAAAAARSCHAWRNALLRHPYIVSDADFAATVAVGALGLLLAAVLPVSLPPGLLPEPAPQTAELASKQVRVVLQNPFEQP